MDQATAQKGGLPDGIAIVQEGTSFRNHLREAMRRSRGEGEVQEGLFLAVPERLLGRWGYFAFGPQRERPGSSPESVVPPDEWHQWEKIGQETYLSNFERTSYQGILLTHGLSAIADSTLLLCDIGRAVRIAEALGLGLACMLADVSWMSYNRSVRRFDLNDAQIESGLRLCLDRRLRLYQGLEVETTVHSISSFAKRDAISSEKVAAIGQRYVELINALWGSGVTETDVPLHSREVARIGRPLSQSLSSDSPLAALGRFPGALHALEKALEPHLGIVRTLAQRFRVLSQETFSYFFAQYYAQQAYRGAFVKVAPESERDFDEPFDVLDESFRAWGEGSDPQLGAPPLRRRKKPRLAAVYLPHYRLGEWALLPYTPLSLDALSMAQRKVAAVTEHTCLLSDTNSEQRAKTRAILAGTLRAFGAPELNRLIIDLLWFIRRVWRLRGAKAITRQSEELTGSFSDLLEAVAHDLEYSFRTETESKVGPLALWRSWLDSIEAPAGMPYVPSHLLVASITKADWDERRLHAAAELVLLSNRVAKWLSD